MAHKKHSSAFSPRDLLHLPKAFLLEFGVSYRQYLIDDENIRFQMGSDGKGEPHVHSRAVMLNRRVEKPLDLGEGDDRIELARNLLPAHAQNRSIEEYVFPPGQLRMKSYSDLKQARHSPSKLDAAARWLRDPAKKLQQCRLAGA